MTSLTYETLRRESLAATEAVHAAESALAAARAAQRCAAVAFANASLAAGYGLPESPDGCAWVNIIGGYDGATLAAS